MPPTAATGVKRFDCPFQNLLAIGLRRLALRAVPVQNPKSKRFDYTAPRRVAASPLTDGRPAASVPEKLSDGNQRNFPNPSERPDRRRRHRYEPDPSRISSRPEHLPGGGGLLP